MEKGEQCQEGKTETVAHRNNGKDTKDAHLMYELANEMGGAHIGFKRRRKRAAKQEDPPPAEWLAGQAKAVPEGGCAATWRRV